MGVEVYPDVPTACERTVKWSEEVISPRPENASRYDESYRTFCQLYPALSVFGPKTRET